MACHIKLRYFREDAEGYIDFPGPAIWWEGYDHDTHDSIPDSDVENAQQAYKIIVDGFDYEVPADFARLAPSEDKLFLLPADTARFLSYT